MPTITPAGAGLSSQWSRVRDRLRPADQSPDSPDSPESPQSPQSPSGRPSRRSLLVALALAVVAIGMVSFAVARGPQMSIVDEPAHAGYLYDVAHGQIPSKGSLLPAEIRYEAYCHDQAGSTGSADCTGYNGATYDVGQQVYTFTDPPVYYAITGALVRLISPAIPGTHNFISVGRSIGAAWLFAAMLTLYLALRKFRVNWPYAFAAAALVPLCPGILASTSEITSDAPAALCGALGVYMLARIVVEKKLGFVLPLVVTLFATGTKVLNGMPMIVVGATAFFMAVAALRRRERGEATRLLLVTGAIAVAFVLVFGGWSVFQDHRGVANWVNPNLADGTALSGSPTGDLLSSTFGIFGHLTTNFWLQPQIDGETVVIWATLLGVLLVAAPLMVMVAVRSRSAGWILGLGTFLGITAVTFAVQAQTFLANDEYFVSVAPRYALAFLPWAIACLALVASYRRMRWSIVTLVSVGLAVMLLAETGLFSLGPALTQTGTILVG
jgi:hypothetical protein